LVDDHTAWAAVPKGGWLEAYAAWAYYTTDAPLVYHLGTGLSVLSASIPAHVTMNLGGEMPSTFWSMLVGEAGESRKTAAGRKGYKILRDAAPELCGIDGHESVAAFMEDLSNQPQQLIFFGEYGDFLGSTGRGSYKADMRDRLLKLWDGDEITKKSKAESIVIERPRLSIVACVAPGLLEKHTGEHDWTDGGMSRWVVFLGERTRSLLPPPTDNAARIKLIEALRRRIDKPIGPCLGLDDDAIAVFRERVLAIEASAKGSRNRWLGPVYGRVATVALKAAMIAAADIGAAVQARGKPWRLDVTSMRWGLLVADIHLLGAATLLTTLSLSPYARKVRSVQDAIAGGMRGYAEVLRRVLPPMPSREVDQILDSLGKSEQVFKVQLPGHRQAHYTLDADAAYAAVGNTLRTVTALTAPVYDIQVTPHSPQAAQIATAYEDSDAMAHAYRDDP